jgi:hypothetical protein
VLGSPPSLAMVGFVHRALGLDRTGAGCGNPSPTKPGRTSGFNRKARRVTRPNQPNFLPGFLPEGSKQACAPDARCAMPAVMCARLRARATNPEVYRVTEPSSPTFHRTFYPRPRKPGL